MASFAFITEEDLVDRYKEAQAYMKPLFQPLDEYERIARAKPHPGIAKHLPKVTDGTLASIVQEQPKRVISSIPTGKIHSKSPWLDLVAGFILTHEILPNANEVVALIQKCWAEVSKAKTYGSQPAFVQFINRGEYFGTDFTLPYIKDVFLEPGKLSDRDSNVIFLRSYYQPNQIDEIIAKEARLAKKAKSRGETYESGWDTAVLEAMKKHLTDKDATALSPNERNKPAAQGYIELVHAFQRGIGAEFYSFSPDLPTGENVARKKKNKDPRGAIPIHYMYDNVDLSNPLGRGTVEIAAPLQNLLDSEVQMYQYNRALMLNPPMIKRGNWSKSQAKWVPNAVIDLGSDPNAMFEAAKIDTTAITQFPTTAQMIRSQILNLNSGGGDTSIGSDAVGSSASSKTPAGVKATQSKLGAGDNYIRRQFESWFEEIIETSINLYFAERSGTQELTLDPETAMKLRQLDPNSVSPENVIRIDYDTETEKLEFKADPTSSTEADTQEQLASMGELLKETSADPLIAWRMSQDGFKLNMGEAYREYFQNMGIKNIDKIVTEMTQQEKQQAQQSKMPMMDKPTMRANYAELEGNPTAQQAFLANAGIELPIEVFQQAEQTKAQAEMAKNAPTDTPDPNAIENHPMIKLMAALKIDFAQLPTDTRQWFIETIMGAPATTIMPVDTKLAIDQQNADTKTGQAQVAAVDTAHKHADMQKSQMMNASGEALRIAQADTAQQQADRTHATNVSQADRTHKFTVQQANKPQPKVKVAK